MTRRRPVWSMTAVLLACASLCLLASPALAGTGTVKGTVTDAGSNQPIANVSVSMTVNGADVAGTTTDASGNYLDVVNWAGAGAATVNVTFQPSPAGYHNYLTQSNNNNTLPAGGTITIDAALQPGGQITGTVTDGPAAYPLTNVEVFALDSVGDVSDSTCTTSGSYVLQGLKTASYHVEFTTAQPSSCGAVGSYVTQYYNGKASLGAADAVSVTAGSTTPGINAALVPSATHKLTASLAGTGSGTMTSSPAVIDCGSKCSADIAEGTPVTLTAAAASGSTFAGWSGGGCSGTAPCQLTMSADQAVTATFNGSTDQPVTPPPTGSDQPLTPPTITTSLPPGAPKCRLTPRSHKVVASRRPKGAGTLAVTATCDQSADIVLSGKVVAVLGVAKSRSARTETFRLAAVHANATAGKAVTLTARIPVAAMRALKNGANESAKLALTATNANGAAHATATVTRLRRAGSV